MKRRSPADGRRRKRSSDPPAPATSFASEMTKKLRNGRICFAIGQKIEIYIYIYGLWLFNIAMGNGPFLDGLPGLNMVTFHGYVK
jgi:hypothetical protein